MIIITYPGRFQPFHYNHYLSYLFLIEKFGKENVYIVTSNKVDLNSPFTFVEKQQIITTMFDIAKDKILQVSSPYKIPIELEQKFNPDIDIFVVGIGNKDSNRLSSSKYYINFDKDDIKYSFKYHGYYIVLPKPKLKIKNNFANGTIIRKLFSDINISKNTKEKYFKKLYNSYNKEIYNLIENKLCTTI